MSFLRSFLWNGIEENIHALHRGQMTFADIIASMDAVISKPGFGILSDCIANRKPLIYADRSNFREYPILVDAIRKYIKHVHIPAAELYAGICEESLARIWDSPEPEEELALGGDRIAASPYRPATRIISRSLSPKLFSEGRKAPARGIELIQAPDDLVRAGIHAVIHVRIRYGDANMPAARAASMPAGESSTTRQCAGFACSLFAASKKDIRGRLPLLISGSSPSTTH